MTRGAGRFAPSPTGDLHLGSLLAATAAFVDARARGDTWHVRMDDLDRARNRPGAEASILRSLEAHGLHWDGRVQRQSERIPAYEAAVAELRALNRIFYCRCSRQTLNRAAIYPGTCRHNRGAEMNCAWRLLVGTSWIVFEDLIQGPQQVDLAGSVGDFIVRRRDGIIAYTLATAVDDGAAEITRVIRGRDLLPTTAAQLLLMDVLGLTRPEYGHLPLVVNRQGQKLSKQTHASPLDLARPEDNLRTVLAILGSPAALAEAGTCLELLDCARTTWSIADIPRQDAQEPS